MEAAFFDLDKTVIAKASMVAFGGPLYREGLISRRTILRAMYAQMVYMHLGASEQKLARIRDSVLALTKGWEQERIRSTVRETLEEIIEPILYAEALEAMAAHRQAGRLIFLVSASPEEIVLPLAEHLHAEAIASRTRIDEAGRYTGEMEFYAYGPYKAEAMRSLAVARGLNLAASWAYSDSYTDAPMLEAVGHPVAVNPDRVLLRLARDKGWDVQTFRRTVPLRPERVRRRRLIAAGAGSVLALAAVAAVLVARRRPAARRPPTPSVSDLSHQRKLVRARLAELRLARAGLARMRVAQVARSLRDATTPSATRMARKSSFFMDGQPTGRRRPPG